MGDQNRPSGREGLSKRRAATVLRWQVLNYVIEHYADEKVDNRPWFQHEMFRLFFVKEFDCCRPCFLAKLRRFGQNDKIYAVDLLTGEGEQIHVQKTLIQIEHMNPMEAFQYAATNARRVGADWASIRRHVEDIAKMHPEWHVDVDGWIFRLKKVSGE